MLTVISMGLYIPLMVHNSSCFFSQVVIFLFEETVKSPDQDLKRSFISEPRGDGETHREGG